MTRMRWFWLGWTIFMVGMGIKFGHWDRFWDGGWVNTLIGVGIYLAIAAIAHASQNFEAKHNIGEARFNSRTGKALKPGEPNR